MDESKLPPLIDLSALRRNAEGATPGEWYVDTDPRPGMSWNRSIDTDWKHGHTVCHMTHSDGKHAHRDEATAAHIAANHPAVTLALCEVVRAAHEHADTLMQWALALTTEDAAKTAQAAEVAGRAEDRLRRALSHFSLEA